MPARTWAALGLLVLAGCNQSSTNKADAATQAALDRVAIVDLLSR
jgi:hypothetical protein